MKLQPLGSASKTDVFVSIPEEVDSNAILRVYFDGIQGNGRRFGGIYDLPFVLATRTSKQFQVD
ncbi:MAG: hypothetical protein ABSD49_06245 [Candidatus Bathyarchaeia archaeon]|jgi:hypothetical protein